MDGWKHNFETLFNIEQENTCKNPQWNTEHRKHKVCAFVLNPRFDEVVDTVSKLKTNKAPGVDNLPAGLNKYRGDEFLKAVHN